MQQQDGVRNMWELAWIVKAAKGRGFKHYDRWLAEALTVFQVIIRRR